jgi:hypothetical protein
MPDTQTKKTSNVIERKTISQKVMEKNLKSDEMAKILKSLLCGGSLSVRGH